MISADCIEWDRALSVRGGYGVARINGKTRLMHRVVWEENHGPIPPGLCVCHKCDNPPCINIDHLFLGTHRDNMRDAVSKGRTFHQKRTHCPQGHELSGDNLVPCILRRGHRNCRTCNRQRIQEYKRKRRAEWKALGQRRKW